MLDFLFSLDLSLFYFINDTLSVPFLDRFFSAITSVNNWYLAYIILLGISFFKGGRKGKLAVGGIVLLILAADQISHNIIKEFFQRVRPCNELDNVITPLGCQGTYSFPSNHAVNNFAAAVFFYNIFPKLKWPLFITAFLVALSRVYLGLHYPSDILGGAIIGGSFGYLFSYAVLTLDNFLQRKRNKKIMNLHSDEKLVLRNAEVKDVPVILNFIKELAEYEKLLDHVKTDENNLREYLFGEKKYAEVIIAEYDNIPVGQALFFHNFSTFNGKPGIYLEDLYVKPSYRGKGIGKALLLKIIALAKERNCSRVEWVVLDWNAPAIDFYKSLGAVPMNDWKVFRLTEDNF